MADKDCFEEVINEISHYAFVVQDRLNRIQSIISEVEPILKDEMSTTKAMGKLIESSSQMLEEISMLYRIQQALREELHVYPNASFGEETLLNLV